MRRAVDFVADHPVQFFQFAHQVVLGVQPACGVDEQIIDAPAEC